jgi:hypothetical protein
MQIQTLKFSKKEKWTKLMFSAKGTALKIAMCMGANLQPREYGMIVRGPGFRVVV